LWPIARFVPPGLAIVASAAVVVFFYVSPYLGWPYQYQLYWTGAPTALVAAALLLEAPGVGANGASLDCPAWRAISAAKAKEQSANNLVGEIED
jgi:hypothetical protein